MCMCVYVCVRACVYVCERVHVCLYVGVMTQFASWMLHNKENVRGVALSRTHDPVLNSPVPYLFTRTTCEILMGNMIVNSTQIICLTTNEPNACCIRIGK
jgi:hypothetical protein